MVAREAIPSWFFVLMVVRRGDSFLLVHERKHGGGWYLPAGRVEPGETLIEAAYRETVEEAGLEIDVEGILRIEHQPGPTATRVRVFFLARPRVAHPPRATPNEHTLGAAFVTLDEVRSMHLRGDEVIPVLESVLRGAPVAPLSILTHEGASWR